MGDWTQEVARPANFHELTSEKLKTLLSEAGFSALVAPPVAHAIAVSKGMFALRSVVALTFAVFLRTGVPSQLRSCSSHSP
jgi:hypothetical protein